jgi:hypothetical protein
LHSFPFGPHLIGRIIKSTVPGAHHHHTTTITPRVLRFSGAG